MVYGKYFGGISREDGEKQSLGDRVVVLVFKWQSSLSSGKRREKKVFPSTIQVREIALRISWFEFLKDNKSMFENFIWYL